MRFDRWKKLLLSFLVLGASASAQTTATVSVLGGEQASGNVWDSGSVSVTVNGLTRTVSYGQFSTPASVAAGLAALISRECYGVASAKADGATITFRLRYSSAQPVAITGASQWDSGHFSNASFSFSQQQTVNPTEVTLVGNTGEAIAPNTQINLTATMAQTSATGTIQFYDRGVLLGSSVIGGSQASYTTPQLAAGAHELYAKYTGDGNYAGSTSNTVYATAADHSGPAIGTQVYWYSITTDGTTTGYALNGNILAYNDAIMGQWSLGYDNLNRLTGGNVQTGPIPQQYGSNFCWSYDSFGNRLLQATSTASFGTNGSQQCYTTGTMLSNSWENYDGNNRIISTNANGSTFLPTQSTTDLTGDGGYDPAGNLGNDGKNRYLYDADGSLCATRNGLTGVMEQYIYDAEGNRVAKGTITSWSCNSSANGFVQTAGYISGPGGEQMTEMSVAANGSMSWVHTNVFAGGKLIATYQNDNGGATPVAGNLHFALADWLGTKRVQTAYNGNIDNNTWTSLPFGDAPSYSTPDATEQHFTGKERDNESGLDYFGARYYGSSMGRFMSPDPSGLFFADPTNPQSLNLYSYVRNNPLTNTDPDGLRCVWDDGSFDAEDDKQTGKQGSCESKGGTWHDPGTYAKGADWASTNSDGTLQMHGAAPSETVTVAGTATGAVGDITSWFGGYIADVGLAYTNGSHYLTGGQDVSYLRFFGTHYCGPGGGGEPNGTLDKACKTHDECFENAGLDASVNVGTSMAALNDAQVAAAKKCNQGLYNAARSNPHARGSVGLRLWLTQSASTPFGGYVLYPNTQAKTW